MLSNIVLDELDHEMTRRGHRFVRYADDFNIFVRSERAGRRVMASTTRFNPTPMRRQSIVAPLLGFAAYRSLGCGRQPAL